MKRKLLYIIVMTLGLAGCITNDLPYPVVVPHVTSMEVDGAENVNIDNAKQVITIYLEENVDLRTVEITSFDLDQDIATVSMNLVGVHDLTSPLYFKLNTYDEYDWKIVAVREVERYFTVSGQVGSSVIDPTNCRIVVTVAKNVSPSNINVTSFKLGPAGLTDYSLDISQLYDFTEAVSVDVTSFGLTETWTIYVEVSEINVELKSINAWANEAYVVSNGIAGQNNGFRYRLKGTEAWTDVADGDIESQGGTFTAHLKELTPGTDYEVVATCGDDSTPVQEFTTELTTRLPNGSFEHVSKVADKDYYKFYDPSCGVYDGSYMFWGSGNGEGAEGVSGSANLGIVITTIDTADKVDGKQSVCAVTSQMAGILAAGNLFTGQFDGLVGTTGGRVNFGRPWTTRPKALKLYCKYRTGKMDIIKGSPVGTTLTSEDYDRAEIKFALGTWAYKQYGGSPDSPVHINTTDATTFIDYNTDASTIANGSLIVHHDGYILNGSDKVSAATDGWMEYTIPLNYRDLETKPTHIIISCASSQFGDYFSGYSGSKLWLDAMELVY